MYLLQNYQTIVDGKTPALAAATTGGKVFIHQALPRAGDWPDGSEGLPPAPILG
jgi:hypothetical protein